MRALAPKGNVRRYVHVCEKVNPGHLIIKILLTLDDVPLRNCNVFLGKSGAN